MTDVAQILGINPSSSSGKNKTDNETAAAAAAAAPAVAPQPPGAIPSSHHPNRSLKMQSMSREVLDLLAGKNTHQDGRTAELPPAVPTKQLLAADNNNNNIASKNTTRTTSTSSNDKLIKIGNKWISSAKPARPWVWAPFTSSSRTDGLILHHWVRANVEYPDYPYARFDIHLDPVVYSDEEYQTFLVTEDWTKSETDLLMELARRYELRWPVIHDRWIEAFSDAENLRQYSEVGNTAGDKPQQRRIEDLQYRYYSVAALLTQSQISQEAALEAKALETAAETAAAAAAAATTTADPRRTADQLLVETAAARTLASSDPQHQPLIANVGTGTSNKVFDWKREKERREQMEDLWHRTKTQELEEAELRKELAQIETQLRKLKKRGAHILAAATTAGVGAAAAGAGVAAGSGVLTSVSSAASSRNPSRSVTPVPGAAASSSAAAAGGGSGDMASLDQAFAATAPTPMPHYPYLQSGRLAPPATGGATGLNRTLLTRMEGVLEELKVPDRPLPTKRVCDLYDFVRRDVLTLLILQKNALQKEGLVQGRRLKLAKMGGNVRVVDEETLMGIAPPPTAAAPTPVVRGGPNKASRGTKPSKSGGAGGTVRGKGAARKAGLGAAASKTGGGDGKISSRATGTASITTATGVAEKKPRKQAVKRKRKTETSKAPAASSTASTAGATATSSATTTNASAAPVVKTAGVSTSAEPKIGGKKRARKS